MSHSNDARERRAEIFEDTMSFCRENEILTQAVKKSVAATVLYGAEDYPAKDLPQTGTTAVEVTKERTLECAGRLHAEDPDMKIAVHNFASATNPGGGVVNGSSAQEEALCRCSTLYPCLNTPELFEKFYKMHWKKSDLRYTDTCIYTPEIMVIKSDVAFPERLSQERWFNVDVITCAAPNLRTTPYNRMNPGKAEPIKVSDNELLSIHKRRAEHILNIAAANGANAVVLGAFGCGAFRNDPRIVARAYNEILPKFEKCFDKICFAVFCTQNDTKNYDTFRKVLAR